MNIIDKKLWVKIIDTIIEHDGYKNPHQMVKLQDALIDIFDLDPDFYYMDKLADHIQGLFET